MTSTTSSTSNCVRHRIVALLLLLGLVLGACSSGDSSPAAVPLGTVVPDATATPLTVAPGSGAAAPLTALEAIWNGTAADAERLSHLTDTSALGGFVFTSSTAGVVVNADVVAPSECLAEQCATITYTLLGPSDQTGRQLVLAGATANAVFTGASGWKIETDSFCRIAAAVGPTCGNYAAGTPLRGQS